MNNTYLHEVRELIDSCNEPLDEINNKIKPIKNEIKSVNVGLVSMSKNFEQIGRIIGQIFSNDAKRSSDSIIKFGYKLASNMLENQDFSKIFSGFRASGGNVGAGGTYIVGEKGPEIFTPHTSGYITSNNNLSNPKNINVNVTINSSDYVSFKRNQNQIMSEIVSNLRRKTFR